MSCIVVHGWLVLRLCIFYICSHLLNICWATVNIWQCPFNFSFVSILDYGSDKKFRGWGWWYDVLRTPHTLNAPPHTTNPTWWRGRGGRWATAGWGGGGRHWGVGYQKNIVLSCAYAKIHTFGATITVGQKMKSFELQLSLNHLQWFHRQNESQICMQLIR